MEIQRKRRWMRGSHMNKKAGVQCSGNRVKIEK